MKNRFLLLLFIILPVTSTFSQEKDTSLTATASVAAVQFDPVKATDQYLNSLTPEEKAKSDSYFEGGYWLILWSMLMEIVVAVVFLYYGLSKWIRKISLRVKNINLQNLIYIAFYVLFAFLITLPWEFYTGYIREHQYGLSNMNMVEWLKETLTQFGLGLVLMSFLFMIIYIAIRRTKERWWLWAGGISTVFIILIVYISPVFIAPLFNNYTELPNGPVKKDILSLARANGIPTKHVYQFDASKQSKRISANVSGMGSTIRISLNDNLLNKCGTDEIKAVMAHEMGHYVLHHVQKFILFFGLLFFIGFWLTHITFQKLNRKWGKRWNIQGISDVGGLPLLMVILSVFMFFATPVTNSIIRVTESEADIFGLNAAREPDGFAKAIMKLSDYRKTDPGKWEEIIFYDHPSARTRISMAMQWKAENLDVPETTLK